jgi:SAM-dependent methyltransferase
MNTRDQPRLLPPQELIRTGEVDHADWNYRPWLGWLQRKRFSMLLSLIAGDRFERLLEVGYGSGVFMPELKRCCATLFGVDPHTRSNEVTRVLSRNGVKAHLHSASAAALPFDESSFDAIVSVSALEFVEPIDAACAELERVLAPGGALVIVTPGHSPILDLALKMATGEDAAADYGERRQDLIPTLLERFRLREQRVFPPLMGRALPLYRALRMERERS